jgi:hypothetical protein
MSRLNIRQPGSILFSLSHCTAWSGLSFYGYSELCVGQGSS